MEEEFYANLKLVSGEEIISKISYLTEEDRILLDRPLSVENARKRQGALEVSGFHLKEWMNATMEDEFIIPKDKVITISEIEGEIVDFYQKTLNRIDSGKSLAGRGKKLPRASGYVGSVKEMKKSLEGIFKRS